MSEEEIIDELEGYRQNHSNFDEEVAQAIDGLLDLYQKEKEKNEKLLEGLKYRVNYCKLLEKELYGEKEIELTKIEEQYLQEK